MPLHLYEVEVPMRTSGEQPDRGHHAFTGWADSRDNALRRARAAYDAARAALAAGEAVPGEQPDGWSARGIRPGWELDWPAATVRYRDDPSIWGQS